MQSPCNDIQEENDLYGDLDSSVTKTSKQSEPPQQINIQEERKEIENLKKEVERLTKENETLKRNMGMLYRTASKELQRKDDSSMMMKMDSRRSM